MIEIIPAILARTEVEFQATLRAVPTTARLVQIDVLDGSFVSGTSVFDPTLISEMVPFGIDLHLMVAEPESVINLWAKHPALARVTVHLETLSDPKQTRAHLQGLAKRSALPVFLALNPETPTSRVSAVHEFFDGFLVLGVNPGAQGQKLLAVTTNRVDALKRALTKDYPLGVDGGVTPENARDLVRAGANFLIVGSALFRTLNPALTFHDLIKFANAKL